MGPYKHHHQFYGGKRRISTGVADYFAVLGMDIDENSFLLRDPKSHPPPVPLPTSSSPLSQISPSSAASSSPSNDHAGNDVDQSKHVENDDNAAAAADPDFRRITTSTSSLENNDTAKTPRNGRNLTKKLVVPQTMANNEEDNGVEKTDTNLHVERFDREIVELAMFLSSSSTVLSTTTRTTTKKAAITTTSDNADSCNKNEAKLKCCCWTYANDEHDESCALPIVDTPGRRTRRRCMINGVIQGGVKLAYRRRRCRLPDCCCRKDEQKNEQPIQPQHYYYTPGVSEISIHYVKIRPSTLSFPVFSSLHNETYSEQFQVRQHYTNGISNGHYQTNNSRTDAPERAFSKLFVSRGDVAGVTNNDNTSDDGSSSRAGGVTARHLSSLARQGAGMLVNVVKKTASQRAPPPHPSSLPSSREGNNTAVEPRLGHDINDLDVDFDGEYIHKSLPATLSVDGTLKREHFFPDDSDMPQCQGIDDGECIPDDMLIQKIMLRSHLPLPTGYDEWIIPDFCETLHVPTAELVHRRRKRRQQRTSSGQHPRRLPPPILVDRTHAVPSGPSSDNNSVTSPSSVGMEAMYLSPTNATSTNEGNASGNSAKYEGPKISPMTAVKDKNGGMNMREQQLVSDPDFRPVLVSSKSIPYPSPNLIDEDNNYNADYDDDNDDDSHIFIPILAIRRQRIGDEERFHEDPSIVDIKVTHLDAEGLPPTVSEEDDDDNNYNDGFGRGPSAASPKFTSIMARMQSNNTSDILSTTQWTLSSSAAAAAPSQYLHRLQPIFIVRRNAPDGFSDIPFAAAKVLDRFPQKNYRGMPFPEEEMPLFCYPGGSYLVRRKLRDWKLPRSFGFVVKNERGDSIFGAVVLLSLSYSHDAAVT